MERQVVWFPDMINKRVIDKQVIQEPGGKSNMGPQPFDVLG